MDVQECFKSIKLKYNMLIDLKPEQEEVLKLLINDKKDVFALLPTGFGKSLIYVVFPLIFNKLKGGNHTSLVISPLKSLMADQVTSLQNLGIQSFAITDQAKIIDITKEQYTVIFISPEAAILKKWQQILKRNYGSSICLLVFDEAHCISSWGLDFRPSYREVSQLQSLFEVPNLTLTATSTVKIQSDIYEVLGFDSKSTEVVALLPDRPNIFLEILESSEKFEEELQWLMEMIRDDRNCKKVIVYIKSISLCYKMYLWLVTELGTNFFKNKVESSSNRRVEMYHANTDQDTKDRILEDFISQNGNIKILICTVAFGMGVNIRDVDIVVHWGIPPSSLNYWQEVGRCARDNRQGFAMCYAFKRSQTTCSEDFKPIIRTDICLRYFVLSAFFLNGMLPAQLEEKKITTNCDSHCVEVCECKKCSCCIVCCKTCPCSNKKTNPLSAFLKRRLRTD